MRFATRAFLAYFIPIALLLGASFGAIHQAVVAAVRDGLRTSARNNQFALATEQARDETRTRKFLSSVAQNPTLKAGLQLLSAEPGDLQEARNTVEDQLSEIGDDLGYDLMAVSNGHGEPLAAAVRQAGGFVGLNIASSRVPEQGFFRSGEKLYELTSVPMNENGMQVALLTVGRQFDIAQFGTPAVLLHGGRVEGTTIPQLSDRLPAALANCPPSAECEVRIQGQTYLSTPLQLDGGNSPENPQKKPFDGYVLRSLQNEDEASATLQASVQNLFLVAGLFAVVAALGISALSSRSVARPLAGLAARLREGSATGELPQFPAEAKRGDVLEIRELMQGFNLAAQSVREGRERLMRAYVEFVSSMAQALDARDSYTAGHSRRVSEYSLAIAQAMHLSAEESETIRVGGLLHDVGKIGISDLVLQKPGRLSEEENILIRRHPSIGRRILENVHGMGPYLEMVELHHENWDGTGYPRGLKQDQTPLCARIVKVADAYDAMTSDRPYRKGMSHADAVDRLRRATGTETDKVVVEAFAALGDLVRAREDQLAAVARSVNSPADAPVPAEVHAEIGVSLQGLSATLIRNAGPQPSPVADPVASVSKREGNV